MFVKIVLRNTLLYLMEPSANVWYVHLVISPTHQLSAGMLCVSCIDRFGVIVDALLLCWSDYRRYKSRFTSEYFRRAVATLKLLMVKHGVLDVAYLDVISAVVTSMLCLILSVMCNLFFFSTLCTILY